MVDADFKGTVYGTINAAVEADSIRSQGMPELPAGRTDEREEERHETANP